MTVRLGFLGAGLIADFHARLLRSPVTGPPVDVFGLDPPAGPGACEGGAARPDVRITWVYDPDHARAVRFAAANRARVARHEDQVLDDCDAVYVCTWTAEHAGLVAAAAARGLAVFCEKPLAVDLATAREMTRVVDEAGVVNQVGLVLRRSPAVGLLKALAADPSAGRPMSVVFRDDQYIPTQGLYGSTWRGDVAKAGAGTLLEHSIHDVDILEWVLGPVASVSARSASFHQLDGIEDAVAVSLLFANGAVGTLVSVWHDVLARGSLRRVELLSETMFASYDGDGWAGTVDWTVEGRNRERRKGAPLVDEAAARGARLGNPDHAFVDAVAGRKPAWPSFADALRAHELVDAIYRSAAGDGIPVTRSSSGANGGLGSPTR